MPCTRNRCSGLNSHPRVCLVGSGSRGEDLCPVQLELLNRVRSEGSSTKGTLQCLGSLIELTASVTPGRPIRRRVHGY